MPTSHTRRARHALALIAMAGGALALPAAADALPSVPSGFTITTFASPPAGASGGDDIAVLDGKTYVGFSNGVPKTGPAATGPQDSTVASYNADGSAGPTYTVRGHVDGVTADPANHRVVVTVNEDGNSALYVLTPSAPAGSQIASYTYSPDPAATTGGGTDAIVIVGGKIFVSASNPSHPGDPMLFQVTLGPTSGTPPTGTATTSPAGPTDNNSARQVGAAPANPVTLAVTDPDSNANVPLFAPFFGGQTVVDGQADQQLIFIDGLDLGGPYGPGNTARLPLYHAGPPAPGNTTQAAGVDDVRWTEGNGGTLYVVDSASGVTYAVTGPFGAYQAFASLDTVGETTATPNTTEVDSLDVSTGSLKPFVTGLAKAKGLFWVPSPPSGAGNGDDDQQGQDQDGDQEDQQGDQNQQGRQSLPSHTGTHGESTLAHRKHKKSKKKKHAKRAKHARHAARNARRA